MCAQKLLEGEKYVTNSFVPYNRTRKSLGITMTFLILWTKELFNDAPIAILPQDSMNAICEAELVNFQLEARLKRYRIVNSVTELANPLFWWQQRELKFPILSNLAKRFLCIPATSASSERLFSAAGLTIAKDRANLLPDNANLLLLLHENWDIANNYLRSQGITEYDLL